MTAVRRWALTGCAVFMLLKTVSVTAQEALRDPTIAPAEPASSAASPAGTEGMTVLVRDDKPYLVVGARLYAPGDKVGNLRVERITEKEIWFHDGSALIKAPRFGGIVRKTTAAKPPCTAAAKRTPSTVAPCEDTQP